MSDVYADDWRPELSLKQTAQDMLDIVFDSASSVEEARLARYTLVELVGPDLLRWIDLEIEREWPAQEGTS